jgi:hypothetical protein
MQNVGAPQPRRKLSICCLAWLAVFAIFLMFYIYRWVQFDHRVRLFDTKIQIGMTEIEAFVYLGPPSSYLTDLTDVNDKEFVSRAKKYDRIAYKGTFFLRDDLVLYFDAGNKRLVYKGRQYSMFSDGRIEY